jgi:hypothetical protein
MLRKEILTEFETAQQRILQNDADFSRIKSRIDTLQDAVVQSRDESIDLEPRIRGLQQAISECVQLQSKAEFSIELAESLSKKLAQANETLQGLENISSLLTTPKLENLEIGDDMQERAPWLVDDRAPLFREGDVHDIMQWLAPEEEKAFNLMHEGFFAEAYSIYLKLLQHVETQRDELIKMGEIQYEQKKNQSDNRSIDVKLKNYVQRPRML